MMNGERVTPNVDLPSANERSDRRTPVPPFPFIVGRGRSGTTLLRAMFDSHPDMAVPPESHCLVRLGRNRRRYERDGGFDPGSFVRDAQRIWTHRWRLPSEELGVWLSSDELSTMPGAARALFLAYAARYGKRRYAEKTPANIMHMPLLGDLFPEARFIHIIRDGRDVTLSYLDVDFGIESVGEGAIYWKRAVEQGRRDGSRMGPDRYREVKYEELVRDPAGTISDLCTFVDLPFDDHMLRYFDRANALRRSIHATAHRKLSEPPTKTREWRDEMRASDVALFEALAGPTLQRFGYPRALRTVPPTARARAAVAVMAVEARRFQRVSVERWQRISKRRKRQRGHP